MKPGISPSNGAALSQKRSPRFQLQRWRVSLEVALWRHGCWPVLVLIAIGAASWLAFIERPVLQAQLAAVPVASAGATEAPPAGLTDADRWASFRSVLPPREASAEVVQRLLSITEQDLAWRQAEFLYSDDAALGLTRLQISVPVRGSYPALRQALLRALQEMPALAIDQVLFQRQNSGDTELQARVRFSIWLARTSRPSPDLTGVRR